ncbi:dipeptide/oligopeptide/nickel ABC transporter permease/ATP-binding protein [Streptantibioticus cattleyicolor]|uniref:Oligopeptide/dipeptide ABC transporter, ATPase subunit n=1 Tax=Streptantibioticus cattleyicolor (strain ATCC 35852 / DSM 46488 / JCM 4925 / NBRC 14057 / NRRL 8057) TaxID=1003195 RepID=F8JK24_STREN|nr:dipeptide/oligopeptide/nickel ABC transporter permease/ATP-binding protein [Streptantibioticus cattleyicolor]AEW99840.1 oligopeptide/dipeptide ABC transporter, ATPase subunit [Streptantibioticus cattleyicolor NRRL 8057 = DSM 46488]CCB71123.1 putative dipeptide ABC transporter permease and ATP-binding protein [Streptantibioticus cattleyicolor NRRL 8057 = DSM 46488]
MTPPEGTRTREGRPERIRRTVLRRPLALASLGYLALVLAGAVFAPLLAPYGPTATDLQHVLSGPSPDHWLGTDSLGRDVLSRLLHGSRVTFLGVGEGVATALVVGVTTGLLAGFLGGWTDRLVSWLTDVVLAVPVIVSLLVVLAVFGSDETAAMVAFGVLASPGLARVVRGATLVVRREPYVAAARVAGLPRRRILRGQVLPRVAGPVIVQASLLAGSALLTETGLGYLGLGVQPPAPTWGNMVADASHVIDRQPWLLVPPGVVIGLAVLSFGLIGDTVRDATADRVASTPAPRPIRRARATTTRPVPAANANATALLSVEELTVALPTGDGLTPVVDGASLEIGKGETVGLVGESGCGKTLTGRAILGLLPPGGRITAGRVLFDGADLATLGPRQWRGVRGARIALVSQEPIGSLDPMVTVGRHVDELVRRHHGGNRKASRARTLDLLSAVRLPDPERTADRYPHELSGGMAQRVAIAMALAGEPELLIADEPTTALDVTVQAEILTLLRTLQHDKGTAILLVSHDWGVVAEMCSRAYVMYAGHMVESAPVTRLLDHPRHPYTAGLLACAPRHARPRGRLPSIPGTVPDPGRRPDGCHFAPRCPLSTTECTTGPVPVFQPDAGHRTRCLHHTDVAKEVNDEQPAGAPPPGTRPDRHLPRPPRG